MSAQEPLLLRRSEAAKMLAICVRTLQAKTAAGEIQTVPVGKRAVRYSIDELRAWIERMRRK